MKIKLFGIVGCMTENERGATGFITEFKLYKTKEEAYAFLQRKIDIVNENLGKDIKIDDGWVVGSPYPEDGKTIADCHYDDTYFSSGGSHEWEIKEFEIEI